MLHHWQNTGKQKGKIRDARDKGKEINECERSEEEKNCHKCPEGCGGTEDELHYLVCHAEGARLTRHTAISTVLKRLKKAHTHEGIVSIVRYTLTQIGEGEDMEYDYEDFSKGDELFIRALEGQEKIGWMAFCQ